jgi:hypothetical protein
MAISCSSASQVAQFSLSHNAGLSSPIHHSALAFGLGELTFINKERTQSPTQVGITAWTV